MKRLSHRIPTTTQMAIFFLCLFVPALTAQSVIQGLVVYPDGQPAAGALVVLDGTDIYATTDSTGAYQISTDFAGPYKVQVANTSLALMVSGQNFFDMGCRTGRIVPTP